MKNNPSLQLFFCLSLLMGLCPSAWSLTPTEENSRYLTSMQLVHDKQWDAAQKALLSLEKEAPASRWLPGIHMRLADMEKDPYRAIAEYRKIIATQSDSQWARDAEWALGVCLFTLGKYQDVIEVFQARSDSDPLRGKAMKLLMARAWAAQKNFKAAGEMIDRLLADGNSQNRPDPEVQMAQADLYFFQGQFGKADESYTAYLAAYPEGEYAEQAMLQRSDIARRLGQNSKAETFAAAASERQGGRLTPSANAAAEPGLTKKVQPGFYIQLGAFSNPAFAERLAEKFSRSPWRVVIHEEKTRSQILHAVRCGPYANREHAQSVGEKIRKEMQLTFLILRKD